MARAVLARTDDKTPKAVRVHHLRRRVPTSRRRAADATSAREYDTGERRGAGLRTAAPAGSRSDSHSCTSAAIVWPRQAPQGSLGLARLDHIHLGHFGCLNNLGEYRTTAYPRNSSQRTVWGPDGGFDQRGAGAAARTPGDRGGVSESVQRQDHAGRQAVDSGRQGAGPIGVVVLSVQPYALDRLSLGLSVCSGMANTRSYTERSGYSRRAVRYGEFQTIGSSASYVIPFIPF